MLSFMGYSLGIGDYWGAGSAWESFAWRSKISISLSEGMGKEIGFVETRNSSLGKA
jgi:hypothetical protein